MIPRTDRIGKQAICDRPIIISLVEQHGIAEDSDQQEKWIPGTTVSAPENNHGVHPCRFLTAWNEGIMGGN
jgi:hypothetical protein